MARLVLSTLVAQAVGQDLFLQSRSQEAVADESQVRLRNGVLMPRMATSCGAANETSEKIALSWKAGFRHYLTANNYNNQQAVGQGLRALGVPRSSYFVTTMTSPCQCKQTSPHCDRNVTDAAECYKLTKSELSSDLQQLGMDYVDLILLHGPNEPFGYAGACSAAACAATRAQWRAYSEFLKAGKARAIGVSNFCPSCFECILGEDGLEVPAVNQVQYHIGMGEDPAGLSSYMAEHGVVLQSYFPLAHGKVISDADCVRIGQAHNKTSAQIGMRWILDNNGPPKAIVTSSNSLQHYQEDLDIFDFYLNIPEMQILNAKTCEEYPEYCFYVGGRPAWGCGK